MNENKKTQHVPLHRSSLKRDDLEAVLESMINQQLATDQLAKKLAANLAQEFGCAGGVILRDYRNALHTLFQLLNAPKNSSLLVSPLVNVAWAGWAEEHALVIHYTPLLTNTLLPDLRRDKNGVYDIGVIDTTLGFIPDYAQFHSRSKQIVENIGHGLGGMYKNRAVGTFGDYVLMTLEHDSIITAGGGVALLVRNPHALALLNKIVKRLPRDAVIANYNAALGLTQLGRYKTFVKKRRSIGNNYAKNLIKHHKTFDAPYAKLYTPYSFAIHCNGNMRAIQSFIKKQHIEYTSLAKESIVSNDLQILEHIENSGYIKEILRQTLLLPLYPSLSDAEITRIIAIINNLP